MMHLNKVRSFKLGVVVNTYSPSTQETEAGGWRVEGEPGLHIKTLSQNKQKEIKYPFLCV
jgi:hypothetical protein